MVVRHKEVGSEVHHSLEIQGRLHNGCDKHGDGVVGPGLYLAFTTEVHMEVLWFRMLKVSALAELCKMETGTIKPS